MAAWPWCLRELRFKLNNTASPCGIFSCSVSLDELSLRVNKEPPLVCLTTMISDTLLRTSNMERNPYCVYWNVRPKRLEYALLKSKSRSGEELSSSWSSFFTAAGRAGVLPLREKLCCFLKAAALAFLAALRALLLILCLAISLEISLVVSSAIATTGGKKKKSY